jgi:hypothetical protein
VAAENSMRQEKSPADSTEKSAETGPTFWKFGFSFKTPRFIGKHVLIYYFSNYFAEETLKKIKISVQNSKVTFYKQL